MKLFVLFAGLLLSDIAGAADILKISGGVQKRIKTDEIFDLNFSVLNSRKRKVTATVSPDLYFYTDSSCSSGRTAAEKISLGKYRISQKGDFFLKIESTGFESSSCVGHVSFYDHLSLGSSISVSLGGAINQISRSSFEIKNSIDETVPIDGKFSVYLSNSCQTKTKIPRTRILTVDSKKGKASFAIRKKGSSPNYIVISAKNATLGLSTCVGPITDQVSDPSTPPPSANSSPIAENRIVYSNHYLDTYFAATAYLNATDSDGDSLSFSVSNPENVGATVSLNPANNLLVYYPSCYYSYLIGVLGCQFVSDFVDYTVSDGKGGSVTKRITFLPNWIPESYDQEFSTTLDSEIIEFWPAGDLDQSDTLTYSIEFGPSSGEIFQDQGQNRFRYVPNPGFIGTDYFYFHASDGKGGVTPSTLITINVFDPAFF